MTIQEDDKTLDELKVLADLKAKQFSILNKGFVQLIDVMGNDTAIVNAARVSYGDGTKTVRDNENLIRYLLKHKHMTPFEMVQFKFHIKAPLFVVRQWMRHRTGSFNEVSARYSIIKTEFYEPKHSKIGTQSKVNKQGREDCDFTRDELEFISNLINTSNNDAFNNYNNLLQHNVSREIARSVLPNALYTEFYWSVNLRNLLHFIELRIKDNAQYEIKVFAEILLDIVKIVVPQTYDAFVLYQLSTITLSKDDLKVLQALLTKAIKKIKIDDKTLDKLKTNSNINPKYSKREFLTLLNQFGFNIK